MLGRVIIEIIKIITVITIIIKISSTIIYMMVIR